MKAYFKIVFILSMAFALFACKSNNIKVETIEDGIKISLVPQKKFLLLPIEDKIKEMASVVTVDAKVVANYNLCLAQKQIDYYMPLDISQWKGKTLEIKVVGLSLDALSLKELKQSDDFEYDYAETYRPSYHFTPPYGWMNDPNGMVYYKGQYHLFYQWNPFGSRWENMTWGHATSRDLLIWDNHNGAILPDTLGTIFSGSAVADIYNTSGLQKGEEKVLLAFYTYHKTVGDTYEQSQGLAYSNNAGKNWNKYAKNPIITKSGFKDFRDPKVVWHEDSQKWVMLLSVDHYIEIYSSSNAIDWTLESDFGKNQGAHTGQWECPDLFELKVENSNESKWVLICNINPGGVHGGSATQYFIGNFDGKTFTNQSTPSDVKWLDWGKDFYAAVTWGNAPQNRHIGIAWMSNWEYGKEVPSKYFRSAMTVPRQFTLVKTQSDYTLFNYPSSEVADLRKRSKKIDNLIVDRECNVDNICQNTTGAFEIVFDVANISSEVFGFKLYNNKGQFSDIYFNIPEKKIWVDRRNSGKVDFSENFSSLVYGPLEIKNNYQIRILVDKASIELFEGNGQVSMTNIVFPDEAYNRLSFYSKGGTCEIKNLTIYELAK
ncbi:MAG: hypothetical protein RL662_1143 [Bacteroidota bacterium]|jgi:fructan beta-fructosidase